MYNIKLKTAKDCENFSSLLRGSNHQYAVIYWNNPIDGNIEERHIYADDYNELKDWVTFTLQGISRFTDGYLVYINYTLIDFKGHLNFKEEK